MSNGSQFQNLLKELSRDPRLKLVIAKAKRQTRGKGAARVENVTGIFLLILAIVSRFAKKKRARAIDDLMDIIYLLVQVSLALKENIFDRPEVKEFFSQSSRQIYLLAQECVAMVLPKTKRLRPAHTSRPA
jgi:wobble nucleotide-excising tRNase